MLLNASIYFDHKDQFRRGYMIRYAVYNHQLGSLDVDFRIYTEDYTNALFTHIRPYSDGRF